MSRKSVISHSSFLGDDDDEMFTEKKIQPHLLTKKTLEVTSKAVSISTRPYDRESYPNESYPIFFSLEGGTENTREKRISNFPEKLS